MDYSLSDKKIKFSFQGCSLMLTKEFNNAWRIRTEYNGIFDNIGAAQMLSLDIGETVNENHFDISAVKSGEVITVSSFDGTSVVISENSITFFDKKNQQRRDIYRISKRNNSFFVELSLKKNERLFGTGERFDRVNQKGKKLHIYAIDRWCWTHGNSYTPIPIILSSDNIGLYMNRYEHSVFDLGSHKKNKIIIEQKNAPIDLYVFIADSPAEIIKNYCSLTGFSPLPKEWCFGTLVCRYHPDFETKDGIFAMINAMEKNDFPWDAVIIEGFRLYNKEMHSELREISDKVHSLGKKLMVYEQCGRYPANADEYGLTDEFAVRSKLGTELKETMSFNLLDNFSRKNMHCIDITSEKSRNKWNEVWSLFVDDIGVDGAKIDFCEQFPDSPDISFCDSRNPSCAHHWYPTYFNILQYRHFSKRPDGGLNFSRGGGIGAQRYPFIWAGDQRREFFFLRAQLKAALSAGLSGISFMSWDMAGYQPSWNLLDRINEDKVFVRGIEFTAFSSNIQTHGRVKRPYDFDNRTKDIYRAYSKLHECLKPYLLEQAAVCSVSGLPMMRHLFLHFPDDENAQMIEDEYMLGCGLLVAPVLNRKYKRDIYFPKGNWVNIFTGEKYSGERLIKDYKVPIEMIPVFRLENNSSENLFVSLENASEYIKKINVMSVDK